MVVHSSSEISNIKTKVTLTANHNKGKLSFFECIILPFIYQILREIIHLLPGEWLHVQFVTADFDEALWGALRSVVPHVKLQGCPLHWTQLVWKKVT